MRKKIATNRSREISDIAFPYRVDARYFSCTASRAELTTHNNLISSGRSSRVAIGKPAKRGVPRRGHDPDVTSGNFAVVHNRCGDRISE